MAKTLHFNIFCSYSAVFVCSEKQGPRKNLLRSWSSALLLARKTDTRPTLSQAASLPLLRALVGWRRALRRFLHNSAEMHHAYIYIYIWEWGLRLRVPQQQPLQQRYSIVIQIVTKKVECVPTQPSRRNPIIWIFLSSDPSFCDGFAS